jgi:hypothetical protein
MLSQGVEPRVGSKSLEIESDCVIGKAVVARRACRGLLRWRKTCHMSCLYFISTKIVLELGEEKKKIKCKQ